MKKYYHFSNEQRTYLSVLLALGYSQKDIAGILACSPATISREIKRNSTEGVYLGFSAHSKAEKRQRCTPRKPRKIIEGSAEEKFILDKLRIRWSPKQISIKLKEEMSVQISHETIYKYIYVQCKGELKKELIAFLRQRKPIRKSRKGVNDSRGTIPDMISIHQRPEEVESRNVPGHWEGDLIVGKDHKSAIGTLVERTTRYLIIVPLSKKDAESVRKEFAKAFNKVPATLKKSLTYDRGKEMTEHAKFTAASKMNVYFCDPHSPWQRGTNENTNGLVRDFFPKGTDFSKITKAELKWVEKALNERPRETLGYRNPSEKFNELILNHQKIALAS
jgi:transposase, IS30 family